MATADDSKSRLEYEEYWWGNLWKGSAEALIVNNVVQEDMLPGKPGRNKYSITMGKRNTASYVQVQILRKNLYSVTKHITDEELAIRKESLDKQREVEEKVSRIEMGQAGGAEKLRKDLQKISTVVFSYIMDGKSGISFHGPQKAIIKESLISIYRSLENIEIRHDKRYSENKIRECYENACLPIPEKYQQKLRLVS